MVRLREIPRTATFAWSPGAQSPLIATGTRAGAVDVDFSNETCLELWDLDLSRQDASEELQPLAKIGTDSGYVFELETYWSFMHKQQDSDCITFIALTTLRGQNPKITPAE